MDVRSAAIHVLQQAGTALHARANEEAFYCLTAVNPHKVPLVDTRTPEELIDIIEARSRFVANAIAALREIQ